MKQKLKYTAVDYIISAILIGIALICLLPVLNTLAISLSDQVSAGLGKVIILPINFTTVSYESLLKDTQFFISFLNSIFRVLLGASISILLTILMAYPLSKSKRAFKAKDIYMWLLIFTMLFQGGLVPSFILVKKLNLIDTIWSLVLPVSVQVFSVLVLMNYFRELPTSLEEAAYIDGANPFYILWKIYVPLAMPCIAAITLLAVVFHWNSFFDGMIYINDPVKVPLQTYIQSLTVGVDFQQMNNMTPEEVMKQMKMSSLTFNSAKVIVSMIPILIIYPFLQRHFVSGMVLGAVKE